MGAFGKNCIYFVELLNECNIYNVQCTIEKMKIWN